MGTLSKIELINFLHSCGITDVSEAMRLKSMNKRDWDILAHYKINKKTYQRWAREHHSVVGKSVSVRKRGRLISMKCGECGSIIRFDEHHDRVCENCGLIVDSTKQKSERVRFALRKLDMPIKSKKENKHIGNLLEVGKSEEQVIKIITQEKL